MKRLSVLFLALPALLLLGGCAIEPTYQYTRTTDGGGYYSGQSAYGNADTVIYGSGYAGPWNPWWGYYGPGWGWSGVGFGATYTYRSHRGYRHRHHRQRAHHQQQHQRRRSSPSHRRSSTRPANRPPPVKAMRSPRLISHPIGPRHKQDRHPAY